MGFGLLVALALVEFIFPQWAKDKSAYIFLLPGLAIFNFIYKDIVCRGISKEIDRHRDSYDNVCYRWSIITGVRWSKVALAAECTSHNHNYPIDLDEEHASPSEIDKHWTVVARSILRIVKNSFSIARYDLC